MLWTVLGSVVTEIPRKRGICQLCEVSVAVVMLGNNGGCELCWFRVVVGTLVKRDCCELY